MTYRQAKEVEAMINARLSVIIPDNPDRNEVVSLILDDVIEDIDETADWTGFAYNEIHSGDVEIALARVLKNAVEHHHSKGI